MTAIEGTPVHRGWRIALVGWLGTFACLAALRYSGQEEVRLLLPFMAQPWLHQLLVLSLMAATLVAIGHYLWRSRKPGRRWPSLGSLACALLASPFLLYVLYMVLLNQRIERRQAELSSARVSYDPAGSRLGISGRLRPDTGLLVREAFAQDPGIRRVTLRSQGGATVVARHLAEFLAERGVTVRVDGHCASACVIVWAGAVRREARLGARIGLHQTHLGRGDRGPRFVRKRLDASRTHYDEVLRVAGFPEAVIERGGRTPPADMYWVSVLALAEQGVDVQFIGDDGEPLTLAQARALEAATPGPGADVPAP